MLCEDIIGMKGLEGVTLVAGKRGLDRPVRWIYFADVIECLNDDMDNFAQWLHGGELLVITSERITRNAERLSQIIRSANAKGAAGIMLNIGQIAPVTEGVANELSIPLFELPWEIKLVDLSQVICKAIITEESSENSLDRLLTSILYTGYDSERNIIYQAQHYGFDLRQSCRMAVFDIRNIPQLEHHGGEDELSGCKASLLHIIKRQFRLIGIKRVMSLIHGNCIFVLFPARAIPDKTLEGAFYEVIEHFTAYEHGLVLRIGVGNSYPFVEQFRLSHQEALRAIQMSCAVQNAGKSDVAFYSQMGIMALFSLIDNERELRTYYENALGRLERVDSLNASSLCQTLEAYLTCNKNATQAASSLYIHRNTLRYRLNKIEALLGISLEDLSACVTLSNAFAVKKYLSIFSDK